MISDFLGFNNGGRGLSILNWEIIGIFLHETSSKTSGQLDYFILDILNIKVKESQTTQSELYPNPVLPLSLMLLKMTQRASSETGSGKKNMIYNLKELKF